MIKADFKIFTDTATLAIYDIASLKHRLEDTPDWWSVPQDEIAEARAGNALFLNLGCDGEYELRAGDDFEGGSEVRSLFMKAPSGKIFIGAAEDVTGGDLEPTDASPQEISGKIFAVPRGNYELKFKKEGFVITLALLPSQKGENEITRQIRI